jgi:2-amino-4-hydroxy-6-hydroxymethyldihydropteridine diphosphokinase
VGSNIEPGRNVAEAQAALEKHCHLLRASPWKRTAPLGPIEQPDFVNGALLIETEHSQKELVHLLKQIERNLGRLTGKGWGPRTIDLDLLVWNDRVVHRDVLERDFVREAVETLIPEIQIGETDG